MAFSTVKYLSKIFCTVVTSNEVALFENVMIPFSFNVTLKSPSLYLQTFDKIFSNIRMILCLSKFLYIFCSHISSFGSICFSLKKLYIFARVSSRISFIQHFSFSIFTPMSIVFEKSNNWSVSNVNSSVFFSIIFMYSFCFSLFSFIKSIYPLIAVSGVRIS